MRHQSPVISKPSSLVGNNTTGSSKTSSASSSGSGSGGSSGSGNTNSNSSSVTSSYKDGTFTGNAANAYYGNVQVAVTISAGKITNVKVLQYPDTHSTSVMINQQAMPYLQQEVVKSQISNVQLISGATFSSEAFIQSL